MRYWTERARAIHSQMFRNIERFDDTVIEYARGRIEHALNIQCPETVCAVMRYFDANYEESAKVRFATAIRAMERKLYDVAYACWDDEGASFLYVDDDPDFPPGVRSAEVLRDLCANMMCLQGKLRAQTEASIDGELCDLLNRII